MLQALVLAIHGGKAFFRLCKLVAQLRRDRDRFHDRSSTLLEFAFDGGEVRGCSSGFLLAKPEFMLGSSQIGGRGFEDLPVGV